MATIEIDRGGSAESGPDPAPEASPGRIWVLGPGAKPVPLAEARSKGLRADRYAVEGEIERGWRPIGELDSGEGVAG